MKEVNIDVLRHRAFVRRITDDTVTHVLPLSQREMLLSDTEFREERVVSFVADHGRQHMIGYTHVFDDVGAIYEGHVVPLTLFHHDPAQEPASKEERRAGRPRSRAVPTEDPFRVQMREEWLKLESDITRTTEAFEPPEFYVHSSSALEVDQGALDAELLAVLASEEGLVSELYPAAAAGGTITSVGNDENGLVVSIEDVPMVFPIGSSPTVSVGDSVEAGDAVAQPVDTAKVATMGNVRRCLHEALDDVGEAGEPVESRIERLRLDVFDAQSVHLTGTHIMLRPVRLIRRIVGDVYCINAAPTWQCCVRADLAFSDDRVVRNYLYPVRP